MDAINITLLSLFGVYNVFHLIICFFEKEQIRRITKPFCLIFLFGFALYNKPLSPLVYIAIMLGVVGDIFFLRKKERKMFLIGTIFFFSGHFLYLFELIRETVLFTSIYFYVGLFTILLLCCFLLYPMTKKIAGKLSLLGNIYVPYLALTAILSLILGFLELVPLSESIFVSIGYILFLTSDSIIVYSSFKKDFKRKDFYIMVFYLLAQFFIVFGLTYIIIL